MATKKKATRKSSTEVSGSSAAQTQAAFEEAVQAYDTALELLRKGDYDAAKKRFEAVSANNPDEPVLAERARIYASVCTRRMAPAEGEPRNDDERYHRAVILCNAGNADGAVRLLDEALQTDPNSARLLYARATAWAIKGQAEAAIGDLRQAIAGEPRIRLQAINDPDFDSIREEPAFIDIIEPTPTGA